MIMSLIDRFTTRGMLGEPARIAGCMLPVSGRVNLTTWPLVWSGYLEAE